MPAAHAAVRYELLRPDQVRQRREQAPIAYVPAGSLEWHGLQNPLGTDSLKAHAICCEAALRHGGVVLPPFYQGLLGYSNWGPKDWGGYTLSFNDGPTLEAAFLGIGRALVFGGFRVLVGVTGHDVEPQRAAIERAFATATQGHDAVGLALLEGSLHTPDDELPYSMDHAGAWETSAMMYVCPEQVDLDELTSRGLSTEDTMKMSGPEGIGGHNPVKYASAELGRKIVQRCGELIGQRAQQALAELNARPR